MPTEEENTNPVLIGEAALQDLNHPDPWCFGVEVEAERVRPNMLETVEGHRAWDITRDGSLRDEGFEFVSRPLSLDEAEQAVTELLNASKDRCVFSDRTSIHVHMDVRLMTPAQLRNLLLSFAAFEPALAGLTGEGRQRNIFSLSLQYSANQMERWCHLVSVLGKVDDMELSKDKQARMVGDGLRSCTNEELRYAYVNIASILSKGTVEFRGLQGTHDPDKVIALLRFLHGLREAALERSITCELGRCSGGFAELCHEMFDPMVLAHIDTGEFAGINGARLAQDVCTYNRSRKCKAELRNPDAIAKIMEAAEKQQEAYQDEDQPYAVPNDGANQVQPEALRAVERRRAEREAQHRQNEEGLVGVDVRRAEEQVHHVFTNQYDVQEMRQEIDDNNPEQEQ